MQPTMVITAPESGMIYINGHFAGETAADTALMRAINPTGAVYIEYRPLVRGLLPMARRLVFSGGRPMAEAAEDMRVIRWPGGITEIELMPAKSTQPPPLVFEAGGKSLVIDSEGRLLSGKTLLAQLPEGAEIPEYLRMDSGAVLIGRHGNGMYLAAGDVQLEHLSGFLSAKRIETDGGSGIRALIDRGDTLGHGVLESWHLDAEGLALLSSENVWAGGSPQWPQTGAETVCAAIEAMQAGLHAEAEGYLSPALRIRSPLEEIAADCDLCTEMKYAMPDGRPCVALIHLEGSAMACAEPLYYRVSPSGGAQGPYQIEELVREKK